MAEGPLEEDALGWKLGRYTLHGEIASGGMATVHIGRMVASAGFSKMVAIKRLHEQFAGDPDFVAMFLDEARLAARVHHPNVVQPLDVIATDGEVFLVMEYVRGESLARIQRMLRPHGRRIPLKIAGAIMVGVLHGLHAAHEATNERGQPLGIVHRDVSPQNVLVGTDGTARVLDFGVAKATDRAHCTREGDLKGKLAYMSPEQLAGEAGVDRRTDVFAASVVLWEILTGKRLYESDYQSAIAARTRGENPKAPSEIAPEVPHQVDLLVKKGLARDAAQRFATAREMAIALEMAMPLATPSKVGEWVEEIAGDVLLKRAARIAEIEQEQSPESSRDEARALIHELRISRSRERARWASVPPPSSSGRMMGRERTAVEPSAILVEPQTISEVLTQPVVGEPANRTLGERESDNGPTEPRIPSSEMLEEVGSFEDLPHFEAEERFDDLRFPHEPPTLPVHHLDADPFLPLKKLAVPVIVALLLGVLVLLGLFLLLPALVKDRYVSAAAERGVVLHADDIVLSRGRARLVGCTLSFTGMAGVRVRARALDFEADGTALTVVEPDIVIDGAYAPVRDAVDRYLHEHPLEGGHRAVEHITVAGGRLRWLRALGERSLVNLSDVHGEMIRSADRALGQDYAFAADVITLSVPDGVIGPWRGSLTRAGAAIVANVTLSRDSSEPATATYMEQIDETERSALSVEAEIPRTTGARLGFPKEIIGAAPLEVEGTLRASRAAQDQLQVEAAFALYGVRTADGPFDVRFQGRVAGDGAMPLDIDGGVMTFGAFRARLRGKGNFSRDGFEINGAWKTAPRPCASAGERTADIGIPDLAAETESLDRTIAAAVPPHQKTMEGAFTFDSRNLERTRLTANSAGLCAP